MNTVEKKFFELIDVKPTIRYNVTDTFYVGNSHCYTADKDEVIEYFKNNKNKRYRIFSIEKCYPSIDILKIEEELFKTNIGIIMLMRNLDKNCKFQWNYHIQDMGEYFELEDKTFYDFLICVSNTDRKTALLKSINKLLKEKNFFYTDDLKNRLNNLFKK